MTVIKLQTQIDAPITDVFDLARDIDFHMESASSTNEQAIAGRTSGKINFGETVTWRGRHLGVALKHTSKIVAFERPFRFTDVMIKGHFKYFAHQHIFEESSGGTIMTDVLTYRVPFGIVGQCFDTWILRRHLTRFLKTRNQALKTQLETTHLASCRKVS